MTPGRLKIWNEDANAWEYPPGGSQVRVVGPFHFDYTDFPTEDTELTIFTPTAGDVILSGYGDPRTAVQFLDSAGIDFTIGEDPDFNDSNSDAFWSFTGNGVLSDPLYFPNSADSGNNGFFAHNPYVCSGAPIKIRAQSVLDETAGEMDLYFVIATPTAP